MHSHSHTHTHSHDATQNIGVAFWLNTGFALIELVGGMLTNSVAILSDALHDLGDSLSLGLAWYFEKKSTQKRDQHFTYGYRRFSVLGALINALILLVGSLFIISEAIKRFQSPEAVHAGGMIGLAILGIFANGLAMLRLKKGHSHNEKVVSLHILEDVLGWVAVLIGSICMYFWELPWLDPLLSLLIACYILFNIYGHLKGTFRIILQAVPANLSAEDIKQKLSRFTQVAEVHDVRAWTLDGNHHVLSLHVVLNGNPELTQLESLKKEIKASLSDYHLQHVTLEFEALDSACKDA
ncbi:cation diffusion facilitator family transporter [Cytophagales bacterium LB-30]|uniref:Cation diffusion facilitator family transporter n=1 Tax=Shiella aurantiaca TaxID=3058365 RepID=A0ABT8F0M9_9BACT|nr:cation diffusion facilitator family transporter [Shiella aurantiaca]MDN4163990.1 cation diffusion facilitator family transporter [Shiella aurantiaca]